MTYESRHVIFTVSINLFCLIMTRHPSCHLISHEISQPIIFNLLIYFNFDVFFSGDNPRILRIDLRKSQIIWIPSVLFINQKFTCSLEKVYKGVESSRFYSLQ